MTAMLDVIYLLEQINIVSGILYEGVDLTRVFLSVVRIRKRGLEHFILTWDEQE